MTKPRFTPDPLPDGLDPSLASFLQRQFDRMNDWWPKDLEDRVKALEKSYPYIGGVWPIVDYSTVLFDAISEETATVCEYSVLSFDSVTTNTTDFSGNGGVSLGSNGQVMVQGMEPQDAIKVWEKVSGSWVNSWTITRPSPADPRTNGFGQGVTINEESTRICAGCPTSSSGAVNAGAAVILTGTIGSGYSTAQIITSPSVQAYERFGYSMAVSADGLVLAIGAPGASNFLTRGRVYIYDWNGSGFSYRNYLERDGESGFGWSVGLSSDGSVLSVGHAEYGVGATGRMEIYDNVSGVFTERQLIDVPDLVALSLDGIWQDGNEKRFGCYHGLSPDKRSLLVMGRWQLTFGSWTTPHLFIYKLNPNTNLFEFCDLIYDNEWVEEYQASTGFFGGIGFVWGEEAKQVAFNVTPSPMAGSGRAVGRVYNFVTS